MRELILSIDQGTTGTTALFLKKDVTVAAKHNVEFPNHYPQPGWVEHDLDEIWNSVKQAVQGAVEKLGDVPFKIVAIGITNQRETCVFWDKATGKPIHRALVWQDRRTAERCAELKKQGLEEEVKKRTGLVLDPYFSGTKAQWLLDHVEGSRERGRRGDLLFGTIDTYLIWKLSGAHVTDASNASRTLLFNIHTVSWDPYLLDLLDVPEASLPKVVDNAQVVGHTKGISFLEDGIPVAGVAGDQQSALFGQACFSPGAAKCTYGTGAFLLMNTGSEPVPSNNGLLTTVAWRLNGRVTYALEGSAFIAGAAVQWLRDGLGLIRSAPEIETLAEKVDDSNGVCFVPALAGLGAPHWKPDARGILSGITGGTTKDHVAYAVLEGVAMQIVDILEAMSSDSGQNLSMLKVDGGMSQNNFMMQMQADLLQTSCSRPQVLETTALGAAFLAGLGVGFWDSTQAILEAWCLDRQFHSKSSEEDVSQKKKAWKKAINRASI